MSQHPWDLPPQGVPRGGRGWLRTFLSPCYTASGMAYRSFFSVHLIIPPGIPISVVTVILSLIGIILLAVIYRLSLHPGIYSPPTNI
jgi:hypothetical protein